MSRVWVPSVSVALVRPHASMPDDVRPSDRVFCVCDLVSCGPANVEISQPGRVISRLTQSTYLNEN
eukprot:6414556-Prymnesium_polylepis.1